MRLCDTASREYYGRLSYASANLVAMITFWNTGFFLAIKRWWIVFLPLIIIGLALWKVAEL